MQGGDDVVQTMSLDDADKIKFLRPIVKCFLFMFTVSTITTEIRYV